jgi:hypothetical protein
MNMNGKTKFLIIGLLLMATLSFLLGHFWSYTICALQKVAATGFGPLLVSSKFLAGITSIRFLV